MSMPTLRDDDGKGTSLVRCTGNGNIAVVGPGDSPGETEAQSGARLGTAGVAAIEAFKNMAFGMNT